MKPCLAWSLARYPPWTEVVMAIAELEQRLNRGH